MYSNTEQLTSEAADGLGDGLGDGLVDALGDGLVDALGDGLVDALGDGLVDALGDGLVDALGDGLVDGLGDGLGDGQVAVPETVSQLPFGAGEAVDDAAVQSGQSDEQLLLSSPESQRSSPQYVEGDELGLGCVLGEVAE